MKEKSGNFKFHIKIIWVWEEDIIKEEQEGAWEELSAFNGIQIAWWLWHWICNVSFLRWQMCEVNSLQPYIGQQFTWVSYIDMYALYRSTVSLSFLCYMYWTNVGPVWHRFYWISFACIVFIFQMFENEWWEFEKSHLQIVALSCELDFFCQN